MTRWPILPVPFPRCVPVLTAGGNTDQGLFTFMYLFHQRRASPSPSGRGIYDVSMHCPFVHQKCAVDRALACPLPVTHFWGQAKPWLVQPQFRCPEYFDFRHLNFTLDAEMPSTFIGNTPCAVWLRERRVRARTRKPAGSGGRAASACGATTQCIW